MTRYSASFTLMEKLFIFMSLLVSFQTLAQTKSAFDLGEIVHTQEVSTQGGPTVSENDDVISSHELQQSSVTSMDDILRLNPSVTTSRGPRTAGEAPQVRGLDDNKIAISIDGVRQNFQEGHTSMIPLDTETLKAVNIYKSGEDFSQSSSLGGGVVFKTIDPEDMLISGKDFALNMKTQFSRANNEKVYHLKTATRMKNSSALISYTNKIAGDLKLNDGTILERSSFAEDSFLAKLKERNLTYSFSFFNRNDNNPIDPSLNPPAEYEDLFSNNETTRYSLSLNYDKDALALQAYLNNHTVVKDINSTPEINERVIQTIGGRASYKKQGYSLGLEFYRDELDSGGTSSFIPSYPQASGLVGNVYVQKEFNISKVKIIPGLKFHHYNLESNSNEFDQKSAEALNKNLVIKYNPIDKMTIFGNYTEGFNAPRVLEVYPAGLHSPGDGFFIKDNFFIPNLQLTHETSEQVEAGFQYSKNLFNNYDRLTLKYSHYINNIRNYIYMERIDRSFVDDKDGTTQFVNIPRVRLEGDEATLSYLNANYETSLTYSRVRGRNETLDLYLEDLPADQLNFKFTYYWDKIRLSAGYFGIKAFNQDRVNPNTIQRTDPTPGYYIHNVFFNKKLFDNLDAQVRVDNLGNTKYRRHASHLFESEEDIRVSLRYSVYDL